MTKGSDNEYPSVLVKEGTAPSAPAAGDQRLYIDSADHKLKRINSSSGITTVEAAGGSVATDVIWDAAGDLAVGTGADTAAKLTKGAAGTVPTAGASTLAYAYPPGYEFSYVEYTSSVSVTHTTEGTSDTVVASAAVTYDGSTAVIIEFFSPGIAIQATAAAYVAVLLYEDSTCLGWLAFPRTPAAAANGFPTLARRKLTPSNASHTYTIKAMTSSGTSTVNAGAGGSGNFTPGYIRIIKA